MENEMKNLVKVWSLVVISLCYCYAIGLAIPKGIKRLIFILPITCLFLYLPLNLSTVNFCGFTSFFIAWLANFKLLLFAFGKGPLSHPSISLPRFLALASLPIKIQQKKEQKSNKKPFNYAIKAAIAAILLQSKFYHYIHPKIMPFISILQMYICLELVLTIVGGLARYLLGLDLEPTFNEPYLATSLQDFWSRRWNRMVPNILKPAVYDPVRGLATYIVGREWAPIPGILGTYLVSAVMHELVFYHLGRQKPKGDVTLFFLIQGIGVAAEVVLKKKYEGKWRLPPVISWSLTMGIIMVPGLRLFIPALDRCKAFERASSEYGAFVQFIENATRNVRSVM